MQIQDGLGSGLLAGVDHDNRLQTSARVNERIFYVSKDEGEAYSIFTTWTMTAGLISLYVRNDHDTANFVIQEIHSYSADADVVFKLWQLTGTPAGTLVIPMTLNLTKAKTANLTCYGGASVTGLTLPTTPLWQWHNGVAKSNVKIDLVDCLIIGKGGAVGIEYDAGTGTAGSMLTIFGYFDV